MRLLKALKMVELVMTGRVRKESLAAGLTRALTRLGLMSPRRHHQGFGLFGLCTTYICSLPHVFNVQLQFLHHTASAITRHQQDPACYSLVSKSD